MDEQSRRRIAGLVREYKNEVENIQWWHRAKINYADVARKFGEESAVICGNCKDAVYPISLTNPATNEPEYFWITMDSALHPDPSVCPSCGAETDEFLGEG